MGGNTSPGLGIRSTFLPFQQMPGTLRAALVLSSRSAPRALPAQCTWQTKNAHPDPCMSPQGWSAALHGGTGGMLPSLWGKINGDWTQNNGQTHSRFISSPVPDHSCHEKKQTPNRLLQCSSPIFAQLTHREAIHCSSLQRLINLGKERCLNCGLHYGRVQKRSCWKQQTNTALET